MNPDGTAPQGGPGNFPQGNGNFPQGGFRGARGGLGGRMLFLGPFTNTIILLLLVLTYAILAISFWQFLKKAGLTPVIALLMLVPVINLGVALWAAFTEWPLLAENARLKLVVASLQSNASPSASASSSGGITMPTP